MAETSLAALLQERARYQSDAWHTRSSITRFTQRVCETLTWGQSHQRVEAVQRGKRVRRARSAIAPPSWRREGLEYIVAFLGAMQAGLHRGSAVTTDARRP